MPSDNGVPSDQGEAPVRIHPYILAQILVMTSEHERQELYARRWRTALTVAAWIVSVALGGLSIFEIFAMASPLWAAVSMAACIVVLYYVIRSEG